MNAWLPKSLAAGLLAATGLLAAPIGISLAGKGSIPGSALDKSGLAGVDCQAGNPTNCVPKAMLGGFGSGLAYTGHDDVYLAVPDRGPFDGLTDVPYVDRFHFFHMATEAGKPFPNIRPVLVETRILREDRNTPFLGAAGEFERRLDPEGVRAGLLGTFYVSDEYGPYLYEFLPTGRMLREIPVPAKFAIANPSADPGAELLGNVSGRQANRGMEGLAVSPNGRYLYGIMQNALLQDSGLAAGATNRLGLNNRILKVDLLRGRTQEFVYPVEAINRGQGVSEILAINDHEFLVLERDNRSWTAAEPQAPTRKKIWKIDLSGATDVSGIEKLPAGALPPSIVPVAKTLFIDLLDPAFGLNLNDSNAIAEKMEALSWGPDLGNGHHQLIVVSDNDLNPARATQIFAFSIDPALIDLEKQRLPFRMISPFLVRKALKEAN